MRILIFLMMLLFGLGTTAVLDRSSSEDNDCDEVVDNGYQNELKTCLANAFQLEEEGIRLVGLSEVDDKMAIRFVAETKPQETTGFYLIWPSPCEPFEIDNIIDKEKLTGL